MGARFYGLRSTAYGFIVLAGCSAAPPPAPDPAPRANRFSTIPAGIEAERITFSLDGSTIVWIEKSPTGDRVVRDGRPFPKYGFV
jgi:hypothetical protein